MPITSTSFANPAVTIGRTLSDTFAGIAPESVPAFVAFQLVGAVVVAGIQGGQFDAEFRGPFLSIFWWTVVFSALTVAFATAIGMLFAVMLNWEGMRFRTTYRTLLFLPYAVPGFISILVFKGLFNQNFGEINAILDALFGVKPAWFADPLLAKPIQMN